MVTSKRKQNGANVAPHRKGLSQWVLPAIGVGVAVGLSYSLFGNLFPDKIWAVLLLTVGLFWAVLATFKLQWRNPRFWQTIAFLFVLHLGLMRILIPWLVFERLRLFSIGISEGICMGIALTFQFGHTTSKKSDM